MKIKKFFSEYKTFASKGNAIDLAIGLVIGTAFTAIVNAIVSQIIMPIISLITNSADFSEWKWVIVQGSADETGKIVGEVAIGYGVLIQAIINFIIITFVLFLVVKALNGTKQLNRDLRNRLKEMQKEKGSKLTKEEKELAKQQLLEEKKAAEAKPEVPAEPAAETPAEVPAAPAKDDNTKLLEEIRDLLKLQMQTNKEEVAQKTE